MRRFGRFEYTVDPRSTAGMWLLLGFAVMGAVLLTVAALIGIHHANKLKTYIQTQGVIVDFESLSDEASPIVEYAVRGTVFRKTLDVSSSSFHIGTEIPIAYDSDNPEEFTVAGVWSWLGSVITGIIGLTFFLAGGISLIVFQIRPRLQGRKTAAPKDKSAPWEL